MYTFSGHSFIGSVAEVFDWYFTSGDVEIQTGGANAMTFKVSELSAKHILV